MAVTGRYISEQIRLQVTYVTAYSKCVLEDLLPAFGNMEERADKIADEEFNRLGEQPANEDFDGDMSDIAEQATAHGQAFFDTMVALQQTTINLFAAGLFHLVEQQLAEVCHDRSFTILVPALDDTDIDVVADWYERHLGLSLRQLRTWSKIFELKCVANAVKHAEGSSAEKLRKIRPELFQHPWLREIVPRSRWWRDAPLRSPLAGDDFYITKERFAAYAVVAEQFFDEITAHFEKNPAEYYPLGT